MACISNIKHILQRDGTNQSDRIPPALYPDYVRLDERSYEQLLQLVKDFSKQVQFYDRDNKKDGDWSMFFDDFSRTAEPHIALMLTFLRLFDEARSHLNEITQRHLDFYYRRFLQIQQQTAVPDKVHLIPELAKNIRQHKIEKGTAFLAGKDKSGKQLIYIAEREIVLNRSSVEFLKSIYIDRSRQYAVYSAEVVNSADGDGKAQDSSNTGWAAFGAPQAGLVLEERTMKNARIGFAIASPLLKLGEGERSITVSVHLNELSKSSGLTLAGLLNRSFGSALLASITGEKGWIEELPVFIEWNAAEFTLSLTIQLTSGQPAVVPFNPKIHDGAFQSGHPVLKLTANGSLASHPYSWLRSLRFSMITLKADVTGLKNLSLQNDFGQLDSTKPFHPFGPAPVKGSSFFIGSSEVFTKNLKALKIRFKWKDLPEGLRGFESHYRHYNGNYNNDGFTVKYAVLKESKWKSENPGISHSLFNHIKPAKHMLRKVYLRDTEVAHELQLHDLGIEQSGLPLTSSKLDHATKCGFLKMTMDNQTFGHKEFPEVYARQSVEVSSEIIKNGSSTKSLPRPPYTPLMEYICLDYICDSILDVTGNQSSAGNSFYHLMPFGQSEWKTGEQPGAMNLLPAFDAQGLFFIGLKDAEPPQNIAVLLQISEDSADPDYIEPNNHIRWSYLTSKGWEPFDDADIVSDSTMGFLKTGVIIFNLPEDAVENNPSMPTGVHWICAVCDTDVRGINRLIAVHTQAVTAVFSDNNNDPAHYDEPLKAGTISKLLQQEAAVKKVKQPFSSFGGQPPEAGSDFPVHYYARVSERLRHKNRAVTIWDVERMILNQFQEIYKVKALNHSSDRTDTAPGNITIIVVEKIRNKNAVNPLQPKASQVVLEEIRKFISRHVSPFTSVYVQNPIYEEIQVSFKVAFKPGFDPGYYKSMLNEEIRQFLSPWAYQEGRDILFGNVIYKSSIFYFVEKRVYVDYIMDFSMAHIKPDWGIGCMEILDDFYVGAGETLLDVDKAAPGTSRSILVSAPEHDIGIISNTRFSF